MNMPDNLKIGERLKLLRERHLVDRKFSQVEFAEKLGKLTYYVDRLESLVNKK